MYVSMHAYMWVPVYKYIYRRVILENSIESEFILFIKFVINEIKCHYIMCVFL